MRLFVRDDLNFGVMLGSSIIALSVLITCLLWGNFVAKKTEDEISPFTTFVVLFCTLRRMSGADMGVFYFR